MIYPSLNRLSLGFLMVFTICLSLSPRSTAESGPALKPGMVVVAKVSGTVEASAPPSNKAKALKKNQLISENHTVMVGKASSATLAFSNGAVINLLENSKLVISQFLQDPFSSPFTKTISTEEPSTSQTKLNLLQGQVVTSVKKLRTSQGSALSITTPVGAAGVRGTVFSVSYETDPNDASRATYTLSVTEGAVEFADQNGNKRRVTAGREVTIRVRQSVDPQTGKVTILEVLDFSFSDMSSDRIDEIEAIAKQGNEDSQDIFIDVLDLDGRNFVNPVLDVPSLNVQPPNVTFVDP